MTENAILEEVKNAIDLLHDNTYVMTDFYNHILLIIKESNTEYCPERKLLRPIDIIDEVCDYYTVTFKELKSLSRERYNVVPRQIAMYFLKMFTKLSLKDIGEHFGGRNHATVMHSCNVVRNLMFTDENYKGHIYKIEKILRSVKQINFN